VRELSERELANISLLTANDVPFGLLEATWTGLQKSILDATEPFREFLVAHGIHDYVRQRQGPDFKERRSTQLIDPSGAVIESRASMYRPMTKRGDPRIWFRELASVVAAGEIFAVIWAAGQFTVVNVSRDQIERLVDQPGRLSEIVRPFLDLKSDAVGKLLGLLKVVAAKGYLPAPVKGTTAVGRLLETELGIAINSRRDPDFMGIEIKSSRSSVNRTTLFAKTPDWSNSRFGGSRALLDAFGYDRDGRRKLSCTISGIVSNSQGLRLQVDEKRDELRVVHVGENTTEVVRWDLEVLRHSLSVKHNETFWVKAESKLVDGWEFIRFNSIQHTQKAIVAQLPALLADGKVTVDFLIREEGDKGYLFKILPKNLPFLFPPAVHYDLASADGIGGTRPAPAATLF
jgi:hypothetical protein